MPDGIRAAQRDAAVEEQLTAAAGGPWVPSEAPDAIHVLLDWSNIEVGAKEDYMQPGKAGAPAATHRLRLEWDTLRLAGVHHNEIRLVVPVLLALLEQGRQAASKCAVGSNIAEPYQRQLRAHHYTVLSQERRPGEAEVGGRQTGLPKVAVDRVLSTGVWRPAQHSVDDLMHGVLRSLLASSPAGDRPHTLVLATGDGNRNSVKGQGTNFLEVLARLERLLDMATRAG
jgi:hypothetical protein